MKANISFEYKDTGGKALKDAVKLFGTSYSKVGIISNEKALDSKGLDTGTTLAEVAAYNEFGTSDGRIPSRPFMRAAAHFSRRRLSRYMAEQALRAYERKTSVKAVLSRSGEKLVGEIQDKMDKWREPANAPSTIKAKKGQNNPLIDTGRLLNSMNHEEVL